MTEILSVSITKEQKNFLEDTKISPSALLQDAINKSIDFHKVSFEKMQEINRKLENWMQISFKYRDFINSKGLMEEFLKPNVNVFNENV
jgi:hypothetical protein